MSMASRFHTRTASSYLTRRPVWPNSAARQRKRLAPACRRAQPPLLNHGSPVDDQSSADRRYHQPGLGPGLRLRAWARDAGTAWRLRVTVRLGPVRGELERPGPGHLHGRWRPLPQTPFRGLFGDLRRDHPQAPPAALPKPGLQHAEWRDRALVPAGAAGNRRRTGDDNDSDVLPRAVFASDPR